MKILVITQYFPPETGAPQNRLFELFDRLAKKGIHVDVITAMPNYPEGKIFEGYKGKFFLKEKLGSLNVYRSYIYATRSKSVVKRLLNYFSFVFTSILAASKTGKNYDFVFCESPPLFLGISAYIISRVKKAKLIFNVSDLWPESAEKLKIVTNPLLLKISYKLEAFLYKKSCLVTGQTQGIVENVKSRFPEKQVYWLPNGSDLNFFDPDLPYANLRSEWQIPDIAFVVAYAGIMGHAQGLEVIIKAAKRLQSRKDIYFVMLGTGPLLEDLKQMAADFQLHNVKFLPLIPKEKMPTFLANINAAVVPLKKLPLFEGAIPSKIFENLAMEKPVILGVEGEAKKLFVDQARAAIAFEPENDADLANVVEYLVDHPDICKKMGQNGRQYVLQHFNRDKIAMNFLNTLNKL
ncbi:MAG: glycosyltransferase WbuB [Vicingaceae bacterium]|nr:MAG: glycosyltransferase WbuB [Vicingaceae bacterium]